MGEKFNHGELAASYEDFVRPSAQILCGGSEIKCGSGIYLERAEITLTCGEQPNMAVLLYRASREGGKAAGELERKLQLGGRMEVKLGYGDKLKTVFLGYLHEISVSAGGEETADYELTCLDVKGLMRSNLLYETSGQKKADQLIKEILGRSRYSPYLEKKKITAPDSGLNRICVVNGKSDYDWLMGFARYGGYEFFLRGGEAVFQKRREDSGLLLELTREYGLLVVKAVVSLSGLAEEVQVTGRDKSCKRLTGSARRKNTGGPFEGKLGSVLSGSRRTVLDRGVETQAQAVQRAKVLLAESGERCSRLEAAVVGLPELVPGRFVKVTDDIQASLSGTFYIEEVRHLFGETGYLTEAAGYR